MTNSMNKPEEASRGNVLSVQEEAIHAGRPTLHGTVTDRVLRLYEAIRGFGPPRVTLDRAVLFTESFKETENQPLVLRWAKALKHFVEKVPVTIFPDELLVGRPNTWFGKWGIVYPELDGSVMPAGVEMFKKNKAPQQNLWVCFGSGSRPRLCNRANLATLAVRKPYDFLVTNFTLLFSPSTVPEETSPLARNQFRISG